MSWLDLFKKKKSPGPDPLTELTPANLQAGYILDYDLKTWKVDACHYYDWGSGDITYEWQLITHDDTVYLEREPDDEDFWSICRKIPISRLGSHIINHIKAHDDPPNTFEFENDTYHLEETGGGRFFKDSKGPGLELISWSFQTTDGKKFLTIEQWGEDEFEASVGRPVEAYQFSNILPG